MLAKPFIKWVGGKSQLLEEIREKYPSKIEKYCEPFVGGGAVLFDILSKFQPKEVLINDINKELINTYLQIKNNCEEMISQLLELQNVYKNHTVEENKEFFYEKRNRYNELKVDSATCHAELDSASGIDLEKAVLFIFLNKTCFNGLYRVNSKGLFNVPFNNAKNPLLCDGENLRACSKLLQNVEMKVGDYKECKDFIDSNTFVYIDPPYRPLTQTAAFTSYSENGFTDKEQIELGNFITEISLKGAKVLASNSDPKNTNENDNFFDDLYKNFEIKRVFAARAINSKGSGRGKLSEILVSNMSKQAEFKFTAEELFKSEEYSSIFLNAIGDIEKDDFAKSKYEKDIAKTKNYRIDVYYHATGGYGEIGLGEGLYLGKDKMALHNFYNNEGEFGENTIIEYHGKPHFIDLTSLKEYESFEAEAIKTFGNDQKKSYLKKLTLQKGFDGIRYFDPLATGEEFVLFNTETIKQVSKRRIA